MPPSSPKHVLYELRIVFLEDDNSDDGVIPEGLGPELLIFMFVVSVCWVGSYEDGEGDEFELIR
jgi:hypothetical protein